MALPPSVTWRALVSSYVTQSRPISRDGHSPRVSVCVYSIAHLAGGEETRDYVVFLWQLLMRSPATNSPNLRQFRLAVSPPPPCYSPGFSPCLSECQTANPSVRPTNDHHVHRQFGYIHVQGRKTRFVARPPCLAMPLTAKMRESRIRTNAV